MPRWQVWLSFDSTTQTTICDTLADAHQHLIGRLDALMFDGAMSGSWAISELDDE